MRRCASSAGCTTSCSGGEATWDDPLGEHRAFLREFIGEQGVQTNEVQRSWVLLPLFLRVARQTGAQSLDLVELGPSAGLNLVWDRYRYRYEAGDWGPPAAALLLEGEERRPVPGELLELSPQVRGRVGIDRSPIDVTSEEGARLLRCFVWAGQDERFERLDRAIEAVRGDPPELVQRRFRRAAARDARRAAARRADGRLPDGDLGVPGRRPASATARGSRRGGALVAAGLHLDGQAADRGTLLGLAHRLLARRRA